jgi:hypothetical protein
MASIRTAGAVLAAGLFLLPGCAKRQPAPQAGPSSSIAGAERMRDTLKRADPSARIGIVYAVEAPAQLVGVRNTNVADFQPGDFVQFLDTTGNVVGDGTVVRQKNDAVHIQYNTGGTRAPVVGDLAVRTGGPAGGAPGADAAAGGANGGAGGNMTTVDSNPGPAPAPGGTGGGLAPRTGGTGGATRLPPRRPTAPPPGDDAVTTPPAETVGRPLQQAPREPAPADDATATPTAPDAGNTGKVPAPEPAATPDNTAAPGDANAPDKDAGAADEKPDQNK